RGDEGGARRRSALKLADASRKAFVLSNAALDLEHVDDDRGRVVASAPLQRVLDQRPRARLVQLRRDQRHQIGPVADLARHAVAPTNNSDEIVVPIPLRAGSCSAMPNTMYVAA